MRRSHTLQKFVLSSLVSFFIFKRMILSSYAESLYLQSEWIDPYGLSSMPKTLNKKPVQSLGCQEVPTSSKDLVLPKKEGVDDEAKSLWSEWTKKNSDGVLSVYSLGQSLSSEDRGSHHS